MERCAIANTLVKSAFCEQVLLHSRQELYCSTEFVVHDKAIRPMLRSVVVVVVYEVSALSICAIDELFLGLEFPKVETGCSLKEILVDCTQLGLFGYLLRVQIYGFGCFVFSGID
jgi:hypothetical protein